MHAVFQEWMDHNQKKIVWSFSATEEALARTTEEMEALGNTKLGDTLQIELPDKWKRADELKQKGTVFLHSRNELITLF